MQCPVCNDTQLTMTERKGIEIDYCPNCRGIWLDRGELDKLIERSVPEAGVDDASDRRSDIKPHHHGKRKKKKSMLSELFDF